MSTPDKNNTITVKIMEGHYKVKCPNDKVSELKASANYLDKKMHEIMDSGRALSIDRVAVIAALNITHELLNLQKQKNHYIDMMHRRIQDLHQKIGSALEEPLAND